MKSFRCETIWRRKSFSLYGSSRSRNSNTYLGFRSRYISRYENLKFGFLPFVVASIVAMVFLRRICSSRPGDGDSADRVWQFSQLVEVVLTAFNPSHGSLSCVETNSVSFASAQARKLNHFVCFSFPHKVGHFVGPPIYGRTLCVQADRAAWCSLPRLPTARFPTCGVIRIAGYSVVWEYVSTSEFL